MEFRILGSIEVVGEDGPVPLGAPKQRSLLAFLLLNANTVVSRDRLVDALWGAEPPRSAVSSLQVYVHGLRRALGDERIERHGTGYRLHLDPSALDLSRFERLVDRAVAALASGRAADAAEDLRSGIDLWSGQPLADLAGEPVHQAEAGRLEEVRLVTLTGPGGAGKTRLSIAAAEELGPELRDGVVFVDLAAVHDPVLLGYALAEALEVSETGEAVEDVLAANLRDRSMLL